MAEEREERAEHGEAQAVARWYIENGGERQSKYAQGGTTQGGRGGGATQGGTIAQEVRGARSAKCGQ